MTAQHPTHHPVLHKPNTAIPTLWSQRAAAGNTHCKRNSTSGFCTTQIQNLTTDEHCKYHPLKLHKIKAEEPLQMQQQPLFIAQIWHNSRIIEKFRFGRSPQDVLFPSNNQCYSVPSSFNIFLKSTNFNYLETCSVAAIKHHHYVMLA